jgi:hypothetical protein
MGELIFCRIFLIFLIFFYFRLKKRRATRLSESAVRKARAEHAHLARGPPNQPHHKHRWMCAGHPARTCQGRFSRFKLVCRISCGIRVADLLLADGHRRLCPGLV